MEASPLRTRCRVAVCWWSARSSPCPSQSPPAPSARRPGRKNYFFVIKRPAFLQCCGSGWIRSGIFSWIRIKQDWKRAEK